MTDIIINYIQHGHETCSDILSKTQDIEIRKLIMWIPLNILKIYVE